MGRSSSGLSLPDPPSGLGPGSRSGGTGNACPCDSGATLSRCCGPVHRDPASAERAEQLMRARYTAFVLGRSDVLLATWHPDTRPDAVTVDPATTWTGLEIVDTVAGGPTDATGIVEFRASYRLTGSARAIDEPGGAGVLHERSRFERVDGTWRYLDGDQR